MSNLFWLPKVTSLSLSAPLPPCLTLRYYFSCLVTITTIISTFLTFVKPTVNAYALNSIAIHILYIVRTEYKK